MSQSLLLTKSLLPIAPQPWYLGSHKSNGTLAVAAAMPYPAAIPSHASQPTAQYHGAIERTCPACEKKEHQPRPAYLPSCPSTLRYISASHSISSSHFCTTAMPQQSPDRSVVPSCMLPESPPYTLSDPPGHVHKVTCQDMYTE